MYQKFKSFFTRPKQSLKHLELLRLQALPSRSLEQIEEFIYQNFRSMASRELTQQLDQLMTKLQAQTSLRGIITHLLLFKDLICIGPKRISEVFLNYKLKLEDNPILTKFNSYVVKIAYTHDIYIETLQVYNNNKIMFGQISTLKGYKTLNYLMQILSTIESIDEEQKKYLKQLIAQPETKASPPRIIYNRIRICLIADLILYFTYIKHAILTAPFRTEELKIEQISLIQQFTKISLSFKKVLYESNIENSYFSIAEQKSIVNTKRQIQKNILAQKEPGILTSRDANRTFTAQKEKCQFSFGHFTSREI